jgi:hypothetical protein
VIEMLAWQTLTSPRSMASTAQLSSVSMNAMLNPKPSIMSPKSQVADVYLPQVTLVFPSVHLLQARLMMSPISKGNFSHPLMPKPSALDFDNVA